MKGSSLGGCKIQERRRDGGGVDVERLTRMEEVVLAEVEMSKQ